MTEQPKRQRDDLDRLEIRRWDRSPQEIHQDLLAGSTHPATRSRQDGRQKDGERRTLHRTTSIRMPGQAGISMGTLTAMDEPVQDVLMHDLDHTVDLLCAEK
ncbi:MAG: hypothetical protein SVU32_08595 [Candidatus Nanohaloarchaea archaeon]|nr:hypothetical protein [Candidatus Nanohaloarchaea archaeon]